MIDVSGLVPEAQPIAAGAAQIYLKHTAPWFMGLIVHGSTVKGGFILGCSDIDFQLYLDDAAFSAAGQLPLTLGFSIRRELEAINLAPFRYVQCYPHTAVLPADFVGPIPGAYHLVAGHLPVPEATAMQLHESAIKGLNKLNPTPPFIIGKLLGHGGVRLSRTIRLLCTVVWPVLYQLLTLQSEDPIAVWGLPKNVAIAHLPENTATAHSIRQFYHAVVAYYPAESDLEGAFSIIENGLDFLGAAKMWWEENK